MSDAIENAVRCTAAAVRNLRWMDVVQVRAGVADGTVARGQEALA